MLKNISHRLIILPVLMIIGFISVFGYLEYKKIVTNHQINILAGQPIADTAYQLEYAALRLSYSLDAYKIAVDHGNDQDLKEFAEAFKDLEKFESLMSMFLLQDTENGDNYLSVIDRLSYIKRDIKIISDSISGKESLSEDLLNKVEPRVNSILESSNNIGANVDESHQKQLAAFLADVSKEEKDMALLSIFVIICGFTLIIILVDAVYHFKNNAERAQAAEKTNAIFAAALQSTRVGVLINDMRNQDVPVVFINEAFTRMTGYELTDIQAGKRDFLFGWNTDPKAIANYNRSINLHETATIDFLLYRKDGTPFWGEVHLSPVLDTKGNLSYYVSLVNDITVFRQTQEDLIQAKSIAEQASAVKTNFLAMMSHEIRTPINGILGVIKLLQDTPVDDEQKHLLGIAKTSSAALNGIINDILDYAKLEAGKVEVIQEAFSIKALIKEVVDFSSTLLGEKSIQFHTNVSEDIPDIVMGDVGRMRQILLNFLSNAIKFTDKGSIRLNVLSMMSHEVDGQPGYLIRYEIQDSGIGISPEDQEKLFQEFTQIERSFTRRFGGTGLGLAICRRLINSMNGEVGVESQLGKGTKFWFMIPMREATEHDEACDRYLQNVDVKKHALADKSNKVLLVEDNETNRLVVTKYLEKAGVTIDEACNGLEAIEKTKETKYDIILMDVSMPEMDGMLATCHIRALDDYNANVPIVALTAHVMAGDRELCLSAGMNDYLNKPVEYPDLLKTLSRWMHVSFKSIETQPTKTIVKQTAEPTHSLSMPSETVKPKDDFEPHPKANTLFDITILKHINDTLAPEAVDAIVQSFLDDSAERIKGLDDRDNIQVIQNTAHTLKSSSGNCGLFKFSYLMRDIETACHKNRDDILDDLLPTVSEVYADTREALKLGRKAILDQS